MEKLFPRKLVDIDGDGTPDFARARHWTIFYFKGFLPSLLLNIILQCVSAAVFNHIEHWGFGVAMYHCLVTATTVGYGDVGIVTDEGRLFSCFHILVSVVMVAEGISTIEELKEQRRVQIERQDQLDRKLDANVCAHPAPLSNSSFSPLTQLLGRAASVRVGRH
jgi:hypothetical protein